MVDFVTIVSGLLIGFLIFIIILGFIGAVPVIIGEEECNMPSHVCNLGRLVGFPEPWLRYERFLWYGIIPIAGMTLIIYGFISRLGIFGHGRTKLNAALSFIIAFSTIPMGAFTIIVAVMFGILGVYATGIFIGLFIFGMILYAVSVARGWRGDISGEASIFEREIFEREIEAKRKEYDALRAVYEARLKRFKELEKKEGIPLGEKEELAREVANLGKRVDALRKIIEERVKELKEAEKLKKKVEK